MISLKKDCSHDQMYDGICHRTLRTLSSGYKQYRKRNILVFNITIIMAYSQIHCKNYLWLFIIMCKEKITAQQKQLFILKLKNNSNNNNTHLLNYYSLRNILQTGGTKLISYLCVLIDLFTKTPVILNLLDLRSIMGCPGGTSSAFTRAFWAKRELQCIFLGKKAIITIFKHGTTIFFFRLQPFSRKKKKKREKKRKACVNTDASILDHPHAPLPPPPWTPHNTPYIQLIQHGCRIGKKVYCPIYGNLDSRIQYPGVWNLKNSSKNPESH